MAAGVTEEDLSTSKFWLLESTWNCARFLIRLPVDAVGPPPKLFVWIDPLIIRAPAVTWEYPSARTGNSSLPVP